MNQPVTLAVLEVGDAVISTAKYDSKTREVFCVIKRADGSVTEERIALPAHGMVQLVRRVVDDMPTPILGVSIEGDFDPDAPNGYRMNTTSSWIQFLKGLKKK